MRGNNFFKENIMENKGIAVDKLAKVYDVYSPNEKSRFRIDLIDLVNLKNGDDVLEVGCGTGSLAILAKEKVGTQSYVAGVDISEKMLDQAIKKSKKYNLKIDFIKASIDQLPFPENKFDVVISSWMFHHLPELIKLNGLKEIKRVLKPGGRLFLMDFGKPTGIGYLFYPFFFLFQYLRNQLSGKLPEYFKSAGFSTVNLLKRGVLCEYYQVEK